MESLALLLSAALIASLASLIWRSTRCRKTISKASNDSKRDNKEKDAYTAIEPLPDFNWETTEPIKIRPFKPKYHLTMALETMPLSHLVEIDKTLPDRLSLRRKIMNDHLAATVQCNSVAEPAVLEFYAWMTNTYLPSRFPTIYKPNHDLCELTNHATGTSIPLSPTSANAALESLGSQVDTDFLFLLPSSLTPAAAEGPSEGETPSPIYHLQAFTTCFPSGFRTLDKLGLPLASIHKPVPGYASKLERSMDRFFARVECGKAYKRVNWTVTTNDGLFSQGGTHMYADGGDTAATDGAAAVAGKAEGEGAGAEEKKADNEERKIGVEKGNAKTLDLTSQDLAAEIEKQKREVDVDKCRLRCERQTLHRLSQTGALVFAFKTYQYTLAEVKAEGSGPELAAAIDGLGQGNVPDMAFYKRGVVWGENVKRFLQE